MTDHGELRRAIALHLADVHRMLAAEFEKLAGTSAEPLADSRADEQQSPPMPATTTAAPGRTLLSQQQLAERLGCDVRTLRRWQHEELVPAPIKIGGALRWDPEVVEAWLAGGARGRLSARVSRDRSGPRPPGRRSSP